MADNPQMDKLKGAGQDVLKSLGERALHSVTDRVQDMTDRFEDIADGGPIGKAVKKGGEAAAKGDSPVGGAVKGALSGVKDKITGGGGGSKSPKATKAMNILEQIDVGVPVRVAYNQWTSFEQFPSFMKKVENVEEESDDEPKQNWKAQVLWSHRQWEATITEQIPDERIVWTSTGEKGHVDGSVSFHEIGPSLTRILLVLEYYPQGFMERTGNIWRAAGRRARLEFKHFARHVMTRTILDPDEVEGWRGTIRDGEIVQTHEEALEEEQQDAQEPEDEDEDEAADEYDEEQPEEGEEVDDEAAEDEPPEDEPDDEYAEDEAAEDDGDYEDEAPEDEGDYEEEEPEEEEPAPRRRRAS
ncbi:MAG TPA: SRPBCC family protein [Nocardioidaceae bacterium]|nr:SRPBCC family protein [Nocardioidaceae bacterium]